MACLELFIDPPLRRYVTEKPVEVVVDPNYIYFNRIFENFQVHSRLSLSYPHVFFFCRSKRRRRMATRRRRSAMIR